MQSLRLAASPPLLFPADALLLYSNVSEHRPLFPSDADRTMHGRLCAQVEEVLERVFRIKDPNFQGIQPRECAPPVVSRQ